VIKSKVFQERIDVSGVGAKVVCNNVREVLQSVVLNHRKAQEFFGLFLL
jgi:hypothetical protein